MYSVAHVFHGKDLDTCKKDFSKRPNKQAQDGQNFCQSRSLICFQKNLNKNIHTDTNQSMIFSRKKNNSKPLLFCSRALILLTIWSNWD